MMNFALYCATVVIWGSTWIAITFQLDGAAATTAIGYRFGIASLILLLWCAIRRLPLSFSRRQLSLIALQGLSLFGINYWLIYFAEARIPSGLVAVAFTALVIVNMIGSRLFFGQRLTWRMAAGACCGIGGIALVFLPELGRFEGGARGLLGLAAALLATVSASGGNLLAVRNQRDGISVVAGNALGMACGAAFMLAAGALNGASLAIPLTLPFVGSLIYLALFGSVLAFGAYLTLIGRIGATRASYSGVLIPIVALLLSTVFEGYRWQAASLAGVALCLAGNMLMMRREAKSGAAVIADVRPPVPRLAEDC